MLASNAQILQALIEGGWNDKDDDKSEENEHSNENAFVQSILKSSDEQQMVQSALDSQTVSTPP